MKKLLNKAKKSLNKLNLWAKKNALLLIILGLQAVTLIRVEKLLGLVEALPAIIGQVAIGLYFGGFQIANELANLIMQVLQIVKGTPS